MPAGQPTKYDPEVCDIIQYPEVGISRSGNVHYVRRPKAGPEGEWCAALIERYTDWAGLVDLLPAEKIEVERYLSPSKDKAIQGSCRADAIIWHSESRCSILEAKTDCSPTSVAGGIGQLLYYKTLVEAYWNVSVDALVLAAPELPHLILESIAHSTAPVRFLRRSEDGKMNGLVPHYG